MPAHSRHRGAPGHDRAAYRERRRIENLWARLKEWRAVATRYDKTAASFLGAVHLAAALDWLCNQPWDQCAIASRRTMQRRWRATLGGVAYFLT